MIGVPNDNRSRRHRNGGDGCPFARARRARRETFETLLAYRDERGPEGPDAMVRASRRRGAADAKTAGPWTAVIRPVKWIRWGRQSPEPPQHSGLQDNPLNQSVLGV